VTHDEIKDKFNYHSPSPAGALRHASLSAAFVELAELVEKVVPDGREKALAFTALEQAKFWASAGVARDPSTR
jgi:hypothetical protein